MTSEKPVISVEELSKHSTPEDAWVAVNNFVYNVTKFAKLHPGGRKILLSYAGKDATEIFDYFHAQHTLKKYHSKLLVAYLEKTAEQKQQEKDDEEFRATTGQFGELVPYGDPGWCQGWKSPFYNDSHRKYRDACRKYIETEVMPYVSSWCETQTVPASVREGMAKIGFLQAGIKGKWFPEYFGTVLPGGIKPEEFDWFHMMIGTTEMARCGSIGLIWAIFGGINIGLPPIMNFGSKELKEKTVVDCAHGRKTICLAITEPWAGSDVGNLKATAVKSACGKYYIVNGLKKWITNGTWADYFTTAVRTGGPGMGGVSLLLIEREMPGVTIRKLNCQGMWGSGTSYIVLEDVKVPVENLIGKEGKGFKYIMSNFNTERFGLCCDALGASRTCYEESFKFANKRKTFGKRLVEHPVIRMKLANMLKHIESLQAWVEQMAYQLNTMSDMELMVLTGGGTALLKAHATQTFEYCAREAVQIFGGLGYTRGGQGDKVERLYRDVRGLAIPGGSEEIMLDLGMKQAQKLYPTEARLQGESEEGEDEDEIWIWAKEKVQSSLAQALVGEVSVSFDFLRRWV